ncbi:MAG: hypothetical protein AAB546_00855 [Patescibacteria group bacterium]
MSHSKNKRKGKLERQQQEGESDTERFLRKARILYGGGYSNPIDTIGKKDLEIAREIATSQRQVVDLNENRDTNSMLRQVINLSRERGA